MCVKMLKLTSSRVSNLFIFHTMAAVYALLKYYMILQLYGTFHAK